MGAKPPYDSVFNSTQVTSPLDFFQGITMAAYESVSDEQLQKEYAEHNEAYYSVYEKFKKSKKKAANKALVQRVLKEIKDKE